MPVPTDSGGQPYDDSEFTAGERARLRKVLEDEERASWAWRRMRVIAPAVVALVAGVYSLIDWTVRHLKFTP